MKLSPMKKINSKLPEVDTTIFFKMSEFTNKTNAINLSQEFPGFKVD